MKNLMISFIALTFAPLLIANEMTVEQKIESAMSAAPKRISQKATIVDRDNTVLRKGSNKWVCKTGGLPGSKKYPWCHDPVFMKWKDTVWKGKPFSTKVVGYSYMLAGGLAADVFDPTVKRSNMGDNWQHEGPHIMLIMPSHDLLENLSGDPKDDDIFVLFKNTKHEIVIIPLGDEIEKNNR